MASTARDEADCEEFFDDPDTLRLKIKKLAALIKSSKHFCATTGAGISTSAGIADFRSGIKTSLETGAGKWAKEAAIQQGLGAQIKKPTKQTRVTSAIPTKAHMALVSLMKSGPKYLKYLISQNCDGLHRRSGIPVDQLSEVHGNSFLEVCNTCGAGYLRDYKVRVQRKDGASAGSKPKGKRTGRKCTVPQCQGDLCRTVVNFGQHVPVKTMKASWAHAKQCDVMLALGTSLTVSTVRALCYEVAHVTHQRIKAERRTKPVRDDAKARRHKADPKPPKPERALVIVNLQKTAFDDYCAVRIFAKIDDVMEGLMRELELDIPEWRVQRLLKLSVPALPASPSANDSQNGLHTRSRALKVSAVGVDGISHSVFRNVKMRNNGVELAQANPAQGGQGKDDVFVFDIPTSLEMKDAEADALDSADIPPSPVHRRPKDDESASPNSLQKEQAEAAAEAQSEAEPEPDEKEEAAAAAQGPAPQGPPLDRGLVLSLGFFRHYGEPRLRILLNDMLSGIVAREEGGEVVCQLSMDVPNQLWTVQQIDFKPLLTVKETYSFSKK